MSTDRTPSEEVIKPTRRRPKSFTNSLRGLVGSVEQDGGTALDQFERMSAGIEEDATDVGPMSVAPERGREVAPQRLAESSPRVSLPGEAEDTGRQNRLGGASERKQDSEPVPTPVRDWRPPARINPVTVTREELKPMDLATTHTGSEHKLYSFFYEATVLQGIRDRQFTHREMSERTGIRSSSSIKEALRGLIAKQTVEVLWVESGNTSGSMYRVYTPSEVEARRRAANLTVDLRTKKVVTASQPRDDVAGKGSR